MKRTGKVIAGYLRESLFGVIRVLARATAKPQLVDAWLGHKYLRGPGRTVYLAVEHYTAAIDHCPRRADYVYGRALARRRMGRYDEETRRDFRRAIELHSPYRAEHVDTYLKYLMESVGDDRAVLEEAESLVAGVKNPSAALLARFAALCFANDETEKAHALYRRSRRKNPLEVKHYLAMQARFENDRGHGKAMWISDKLKSYEGALASLLEEHDNSVAVVGNSPCEIGRQRGAEIDAHALVIRFNNFSVAPPFDVDYGSKTNIWACTGGQSVDQADLKHFQLILVGGTNIVNRHKSSRYWNTIAAYLESGKPLEFLPREWSYELLRIIEGPPSTGLQILYFLYKLSGPLNRSSVFGFAFTDHLGSEGRDPHYYDKKQVSLHHQWEQERRFFESIVR